MQIGDQTLDLAEPWSTATVINYVVRGFRTQLICDKTPESAMDLNVSYKTTEELQALGVHLDSQDELAKLMLLEVAACLHVCGHGLDLCFAKHCFNQLLDAWRQESEASFLAAFQPLIETPTVPSSELRNQVIQLRNHQALETRNARV
jgi:hypothetical protein